MALLLVLHGAVALTTTSRGSLGRQTVRMGVTLEEDAGGLKYVHLTHKSGSSAKVFVYGADVTSYVDAQGTEWIAVRPDAKMDGSKPISGGLSHCFPQFGPGPIQQHGFARNVDWSMVDMDESSVTFSLDPNDYTKAMWDEPFSCFFKVGLTEAALETVLTVNNVDLKSEGFEFQAALHSYFDVSSIGATTISGDSFEGSSYLDKMADPPATCTETRKEITIAEEYDRVYKGVSDPVLKDEGKKRQLKILNKQGYKDTVIWSPYGNEAMGFNKFVCVESVAFDKVTLAGGESWVGEMALVPEPL
ncbi:hypothetical protein CTAYLR_004986 [Chrysophaeum taylorii]|uniref:glucose-6-phosphate 1-epimerase n=1 Tax=Chrysophaeum taylorii TaxID=2483200 RepID=A0AAD7UAW2_9STRA|nr:hypothetical protein CTAYLR_004986 [Chrysophaeum taylorii]